MKNSNKSFSNFIKNTKQIFSRFLKYIAKNWLYVLLFFIFVGIDQITKMILDGKYISLIEGVLSFNSSHNQGAGWSILSGKVWLLILISVVFLIFILVFNYFQKNKTPLYKVGYILIISGAFGNLIDRIFLNYVRDFLSFDLINFPIFNFADTCLTIGVILFCIYLLFFDSKDKNDKLKNNTESEVENKE